jgi:Flp pilus assembly protein TadG
MLRLGSRKNDKGSGIIEFALAMSTILLVLFGLIDVGRALYSYNWISDSARRATRYAMVRGSKCTGLTSACPASEADVDTYVNSLAVGIDTSQVTITPRCFATNTAASSPLPCAPPGWVSVKVAYNFHFLSPLFPLTWTMTSQSERVVQE